MGCAVRVGIISNHSDLLRDYKLQSTNYDLSGLNGKNYDLFRIIDYELVWDFSQNWAISKLVKLSQNYHNIEILSNIVKISHHMIVELSVPFL
jgi:hypothetical protein